MTTETDETLAPDEEYKWGFSKPENYIFKSRKGLSHEIVEEISEMKGEPQWMRDFRHKSLDVFLAKPMPTWGGDLSTIDFDDIYYYIKPTQEAGRTWDDLPTEIRDTFNALGIPQAEQKYLAGVGAQYECLSGDARVYTARGLVPIREIQAGDTVFSFDEEAHKIIPAKVRATAEKGEREVFEVKVGTRKIKATANHPFLALAYSKAEDRQRGHYTREWKYLEDLSVGDLVAVTKTLPETGAEYTLQQSMINARVGSGSQTLTLPHPDEVVQLPEFAGFEEIEAITAAGVEMVYDIEVDGPHNFVAEGLIVHNSEVIYHKVREDLEKLGVIFVDPNTAFREHEELFRPYFATVIPPNDNKFAALNSAVWSGGSFIYIPKGVKVEIPLQAYFRINAKNMGQFERTLIIADEDSYVHYVEGCTAPTYTTDSLHSAVVEIIVKKNARVRYTTIQNWSKNVYNLVTKRAMAYESATMEWVDGNLGCVAQGSTVTTPEGLKPIEDIQIGERVLSFDEATGQLCFQPVTAKRYSGDQPVHTVSRGERAIQVTANHPFLSYTYEPEAAKELGRYRLAYVRADHLQEAIIPHTSLEYGAPHKLAMPSLVTEFASYNQYASDLTMTRARTSRMITAEYTTDDLMWLFGYWIGDGDIEVKAGKTTDVMRYAKVGFSTPTTDRARERLVQTMTAVITATPTERADGHHLFWSSKELAEFFHANGFVGKAYSKRVPAWIWSLPESQRCAFIAGYLDADGFVSRGRLHIKSVNRMLLADIASLLVTLGVTSRLRAEFSEPKQVMIMGVPTVAKGMYVLSFRADERLLRFTSSAIRDTASSQQRPSRVRRAIGRSDIELPDSLEVVSVKVSEPTAEAMPTWDIEVEGTGNFVSQGFIVHNSKLTMKYPAVWLMEPHARGEVLSVAFSGDGQHQDAGGKVVHVAPHTSSQIVSKSISKGTGRSSYRGLLKVHKGAFDVRSNVRCDALLLDETSRTDTYPYIEIEEDDVEVGHEATVSKVGEEQLFYLMSRGLSESEAYTMIVSGFIEPIAKELPLEYAVELNRLIQLEMSGSVG
jgi:Fe-S cluster assembly scaffold protein SufB